MDRKQFFHGQAVQFGDLNGAFDQVDARFSDRYIDTGSHGVNATPYRSPTVELTVIEAAIPDMTVLIEPGSAETKLGKRLNLNVQVSQNAAVDVNDVSVIPTGGNERYISIFALQAFSESDPRLDVTGASTVNFNKTVTATFEVIAGAEAAIAVPPNAPLPVTRTDAVLLADILISPGTVAIPNSIIDVTRKELSDFRSHLITPQEALNMINERGSAVIENHALAYREALPLAWAIFDASPGGNPVNPFTLKSSYNVVKVERAAVSAYRIFVPFTLFSAVGDAGAMVSANTTFGSAQVIPLTLASPDAYIQIGIWEGDPPAGVEPTHVCVWIFGRPNV